ncbi:hypothetical protein ACFZDJ_21385 [Streptomyces sp. NPDC007896]|uniref:hypothetical protein n=1 Tax=Streptomyces sp. NPDC007896 TaxID=3364784 RepID=UPI0036E43221
MRRLNRIESLGEGLRAALEEIARTSPGFIVPLLRPGWDERHGRKVGISRLPRRKNASADKLVEQIGAGTSQGLFRDFQLCPGDFPGIFR